ncbi:hypothetical protein SNEBB_006906 [Seison nebaliae]|nr:hypothetical protein SNEBB_006906 [Seison nebaliae]
MLIFFFFIFSISFGQSTANYFYEFNYATLPRTNNIVLQCSATNEQPIWLMMTSEEHLSLFVPPIYDLDLNEHEWSLINKSTIHSDYIPKFTVNKYLMFLNKSIDLMRTAQTFDKTRKHFVTKLKLYSYQYQLQTAQYVCVGEDRLIEILNETKEKFIDTNHVGNLENVVMRITADNDVIQPKIYSVYDENNLHKNHSFFYDLSNGNDCPYDHDDDEMYEINVFRASVFPSNRLNDIPASISKHLFNSSIYLFFDDSNKYFFKYKEPARDTVSSMFRICFYPLSPTYWSQLSIEPIQFISETFQLPPINNVFADRLKLNYRHKLEKSFKANTGFSTINWNYTIPYFFDPRIGFQILRMSYMNDEERFRFKCTAYNHAREKRSFRYIIDAYTIPADKPNLPIPQISIRSGLLREMSDVEIECRINITTTKTGKTSLSIQLPKNEIEQVKENNVCEGTSCYEEFFERPIKHNNYISFNKILQIRNITKQLSDGNYTCIYNVSDDYYYYGKGISQSTLQVDLFPLQSPNFQRSELLKRITINQSDHRNTKTNDNEISQEEDMIKIIVKKKQQLSLDCHIKDGWPFPQIKWLKDGKEIIRSEENCVTKYLANADELSQINDNETIKNIYNELSVQCRQILLVEATNSDVNGKYTCIADNNIAPRAIRKYDVEVHIGNRKLTIIISLSIGLLMLLTIISITFRYKMKLKMKNNEIRRLKNLLESQGEIDENILINEQTKNLTYNTEYEIDDNMLQYGDKIGQGQFGDVYSGWLLTKQKTVTSTSTLDSGFSDSEMVFLQSTSSSSSSSLNSSTEKFVEWCKRQFDKIFFRKLRTANELTTNSLYTKNDKNMLKRIKVAIKRLKMNDNNMEVMVAELKILSFVKTHRNIVKFYGARVNEQWPLNARCIVLELCKFGSLKDFLQENFNEYKLQILTEDFDETDPPEILIILLHFMHQIIKGMMHLVNSRIVHCDLAARNVLVAEDGALKICDFGLSKSQKQAKENNEQKLLPIKWMAPEAISSSIFTEQTDIWSFGILLFELFSLGYDPYSSWRSMEFIGIENSKKDIPFGELINGIMRGNIRPSKTSLTPKSIYELMCCCWKLNEKERPSFSQLNEHMNVIMNCFDEEEINFLFQKYFPTTCPMPTKYSSNDYLSKIDYTKFNSHHSILSNDTDNYIDSFSTSL